MSNKKYYHLKDIIDKIITLILKKHLFKG